MVPSSLLVSLLVSLWIGPDDYALPSGGTLVKDESTQDGTRRVTYTHQGNTVEVEIDLNGNTVETTTDPNGRESVREFQTDLHADGSRTETHDEGAGRTRRRTIDPNGNTVMRESIDEQPRRDDPTTIDREIRRTEYYPDGQRASVTTIKEEDVLGPDGSRLVRKRSSRTETFDPEGNRTSLVREELEIIDWIDGLGGVAGGTRTTQTLGPDGKPGRPVREVIDRETQQWVPDPATAPQQQPQPQPDVPEPISEGPARRAGYVALSPGIIHIALPGGEVGYQWGARGGVEFPCGGPCAIAAGLSFQHSVASANAHQLRTQAEAMPGARLVDDRLFVFGDVALGHVANVSSIRFMGETNRFTNHGVALGLGAGVSYTVWRELYVGGRFGADLQWFPSSSGTFGGHNLVLDAFIGWRFPF